MPGRELGSFGILTSKPGHAAGPGLTEEADSRQTHAVSGVTW